ncbi:hypothetical protein FB567DRAFT_552897 [Paraphoma chrysanthemicola]|uniref:Uncharacterized protein n=1 Tax=Paraphoma chrysanthemicola TaxID=798071 RepID=A0A8K0VU84_9PLEO|nr:hypothetical protein FB567DRAFT_552897 [Paraphoma chrysanthemicola]
MTRDYRTTAKNVGLKALMLSAAAVYLVRRARNERSDPVREHADLTNESRNLFPRSEGSPGTPPNVGLQAQEVREQQDQGWYDECIERWYDLNTKRAIFNAQTMASKPVSTSTPDDGFRSAIIQPTPIHAARPKHACLSSTGFDEVTSEVAAAPVYEQQTGIIRPSHTSTEVPAANKSSGSPSLYRRGAVRRGVNPIFARPVPEDFDRQNVRA